MKRTIRNRLLMLKMLSGGGGYNPATMPPLILSPRDVNCNENAVLAHTLTANESVTWSIVAGLDAARFEISGTTLRWLGNGVKDFEAPNDANADNIYSVTIRATDLSSMTRDATFNVTVIDIADPIIVLTGTTVNEDAAVATVVGALTIANAYTGTPTYTMVDGAGGKFAVTGSNVTVSGVLDYETASTHAITVGVSGITPSAANKIFTVLVLDTAEPTTVPATWNPADKEAAITLSSGNLVAATGTDPGFTYSAVKGFTGASTGKYYFEVTLTAMAATGYLPYTGVGYCDSTMPLTQSVCGGGGSGPHFGMAFDGNVYDYTTGPPFGTLAACPVGSTVGLAVDFDNHRAWWRIITGGSAGNWNNSGTANPDTNTGGLVINALMNGMTLYPCVSHNRNSATTSEITTANFGATAFAAVKPALFNKWEMMGTGGGGGTSGDTKNIVTDYGAVANAQWALATLSITTNVLTSTTSLWASGDVGKAIVVGQAGGGGPQGGSPLLTTITGFTSATQITLGASAGQVLSAEPNIIVAWGTNNDTAFNNFRSAYYGLSVTLTIPAGNYLVSSGNFGGLFNGIRNITVNATGATVCGGTFQIQADAQYEPAGHSARTVSVSAGASFVTLTTPSQVSRFIIGNYALMTGFGLQYGGYPTNHQRFEYVMIAAIDSDSGSPTYGKITFVAPLVNSYLSTWPLYADENAVNPGTQTFGGPATLYAMNPNFNHTAVINGLTVAHHAQWAMAGLSHTFNNCVFKGIYGPYPTMSKVATFTTCDGTDCHMEVDKLNEAVTLTGCIWAGIGFQSTSTTICILDDTDVRYSIVGSPYKIVIRNGCTIGTLSGIGAWAPGAIYGYSNEISVSDSQIKNFGAVSTHESGHVIIGGTGTSVGVNVDFTMSGGVIIVPLSYKSYGWIEQWTVTGHKLFYSDAGYTIGSLTITDVTYDATNVYVQTDKSGGFPPRSYNPAFGLRLISHPAPVCAFTNVTGCPEVVDLSNAGAVGLPLYSYSKRTYDGSVAVMSYWQVWGRVKKIVVNVTQAYTGAAGGPVLLTLGVNVSNVLIKMSDYSDVTWSPVIDLKKTGIRTFDATAGTYPVTWSTTAVAAADTLPGMTFAMWAPGNLRPNMTDVSAEAAGLRPIFSVEVITDQGF